jgi:hypothetical protein
MFSSGIQWVLTIISPFELLKLIPFRAVKGFVHDFSLNLPGGYIAPKWAIHITANWAMRSGVNWATLT